jgi:hypothetical protein
MMIFDIRSTPGPDRVPSATAIPATSRRHNSTDGIITRYYGYCNLRPGPGVGPAIRLIWLNPHRAEHIEIPGKDNLNEALQVSAKRIHVRTWLFWDR